MSESVAFTSGRLTRTAERKRARAHVTYEHEKEMDETTDDVKWVQLSLTQTKKSLLRLHFKFDVVFSTLSFFRSHHFLAFFALFLV